MTWLLGGTKEVNMNISFIKWLYLFYFILVYMAILTQKLHGLYHLFSKHIGLCLTTSHAKCHLLDVLTPPLGAPLMERCHTLTPLIVVLLVSHNLYHWGMYRWFIFVNPSLSPHVCYNVAFVLSPLLNSWPTFVILSGHISWPYWFLPFEMHRMTLFP